MKNIQEKICLRFPMDGLWNQSKRINKTVFALVDKKKIDGIGTYYPVNEIIQLIKDKMDEEHIKSKIYDERKSMINIDNNNIQK